MVEAAQAPWVRSQSRPDTNGPRSTTGTVRVTPVAGYRNVTRVPHGSVRWATPIVVFVSFLPQAMPLP